MGFDIARVLKGVVAFNLMLMSASNANCSTEGTVSEPLETAVTVVNIISNIGWMYTAIRPVAKSAIEVFVPGSKPTIRNEITRHPIQRILYSNGLACVATVVSSFFNLYDRLSFSPIAGGAIPVVTLIGQGIIDVYKIYRRCTQGPFNPEELSFEDHLEYYKKLHPKKYSKGLLQRLYREWILTGISKSEIDSEIRSSCLAMIKLKRIDEIPNPTINITDLIADGITPLDLYESGVPIPKLLNDAGQSYLKLHDAGISTKELKKHKTLARLLDEEDIPVEMMISDGWSPEELYREGIPVNKLIEAKVSLLELYLAGVEIDQFKDAGITRKKIEEIDINPQRREEFVKQRFLSDFGSEPESPGSSERNE